MNTGGAETFLMKIYRKLNHDEYHFDFCVSSKTPGFYDEEIRSFGSNIFYVHPKTQSFKEFKKDLKNVLKSDSYDVVYRCGATGFMAIDLWVAKKCGVKIRAFRSTNAGTTENKLRQVFNVLTRRLLTSVCNVKIAPSMLAAEYTFGKRVAHKKVHIINNGIDTEVYKFSKHNSEEIKRKLNIEDKKVFLHVGRFVEQKNHAFLIDIFAKYLEKHNDAVLVLIGEGPLKEKVCNLIESYGIQNNVIFLPITGHVEEYLHAADVLLLPSLFEGMPNVVVEAQCSGLPCIVSNNVTREANIINLVQFCSINDPKQWVEKMEATCRGSNSELFAQKMKEAGYDITDTSKRFIDALFNN